MKKVYIAGKITGEPRYKEIFAKEADRQRAAGNIVLNPAELPEDMKPADYMRICLAMIDVADEVVFLPNFFGSRGATIERSYCAYTGKPMEGAKVVIPNRRALCSADEPSIGQMQEREK